MQLDAPITPWLEHLRELLPPEGVVYVGAGAGNGEWIRRLRQWDVPNVTLVEADEAAFRYLQHAALDRDDWRAVRQFVSGEAGTVAFHHANSSAESGLVEPEALRCLWPNIRTRRVEARQATSLADLLREAQPAASWIVLDCLPALPMVQGAEDLLEAVDVIVARVLAEKSMLPGHMADRESLEQYLHACSYRCVGFESERHPALGHALYVRDLPAVARKLRSEGRRLRQRVKEAQSAVQQLGVESREQIDALEAALGRAHKESRLQDEETVAKAVALEKELIRLGQKRQHLEALEQASARREQELRTELGALQATLKNEQAGWAREKVELTRKIEQAQKLAARRESELGTLTKRLEQVQAESAETERRQVLMRDELNKAEAQIELIKELLLHDLGPREGVEV